MEFKNIKSSSYSLMNVGLLLIALVLINIVALNLFFRIDLTQDKQYTITNVSKNTVKNLDDVLTVKVFINEELPPTLLPLSQYIRDILNEYKAYSGGKMVVKFVDPLLDEEAKLEAQSLGIPEIKMNFYEKDKVEVRLGYLGMAFLYADKAEIIPVIKQQQSGFEYDFTSAVKKVTATEIKTIGLLVGHGEHGIGAPGMVPDGSVVNDYQYIVQALAQNYEITPVDNPFVMDSVETLIVAGPKTALNEADLYLIDQHLVKGKNVIFLVDSWNIDLATGVAATPIKTGLEPLLEHYGVRVNKDFLLDESHDYANVRNGIFSYLAPYKFWVVYVNQNLNKENPITAKIESFILPWASSLEIIEKENIISEVLATTTKDGWLQTGANLDINQEYNPVDRGQKVAIVLLRGNFTSYFAGKELSEDIPEEDRNNFVANATMPGSIIVVGDSDFASDGNVSTKSGNGELMQNMVDYLTLDSDLIKIRSRAITDRPIRELEEDEKTKVKIYGVLFMPIVFVIYGLARLYLRKRKQKMYI